VEIRHLKAAGKDNWGKMPEVIARINQARSEGVDVAADTYAYTAWFNSLSAFIPPWAHDGGDAKLIERLKDPATRARIRKDMETPSQTWGQRMARESGAGGHSGGGGQPTGAASASGQADQRDCGELSRGRNRLYL
jgi:dihydroorotase/N-acyl-D-amino-acid deacylase